MEEVKESRGDGQMEGGDSLYQQEHEKQTRFVYG